MVGDRSRDRTQRFILDAEVGEFSHAELCRRHNISRKTGYRWLERYENEGPDGLRERSHRPHSCPHATEPHVLEAAFQLRRRRPRWGAAKILGRLVALHPDWSLPSSQVLHVPARVIREPDQASGRLCAESQMEPPATRHSPATCRWQLATLRTRT
jgi:transposase